jgi:tetratricopeptide (TPR) repeat protein
VATSYFGIGNVYDSQGQYEQALQYYQKGFEINIKVSGQDHPDVAKSYLGIGNVYASQGQYEQALEYYQNGSRDQHQSFRPGPPGRGRIIYQHRGSV